MIIFSCVAPLLSGGGVFKTKTMAKQIFNFEDKQIQVDGIDLRKGAMQEEKENMWMLGFYAQKLRSTDPEAHQFPARLVREIADNSGFTMKQVEKMLIGLAEIEFHTEI